MLAPQAAGVIHTDFEKGFIRAEVIKYAQLDGSISLVLRSPDDFIDPTTGEPIPVPEQVPTTGIILKTLVDTYGVIPPELVETVLPANAAETP